MGWKHSIFGAPHAGNYNRHFTSKRTPPQIQGYWEDRNLQFGPLSSLAVKSKNINICVLSIVVRSVHNK